MSDERIFLARDTPIGRIEFEQRPPARTGYTYRAYHLNELDGRRTRKPSVTTILNDLAKPALMSWYEEQGVRAALTAERAGQLQGVEIDNAVDVLRARKESAKDVARAAAQRGWNIHAVLEAYSRTGQAPNPIDHPLEHRGYIRGLVGWLLADDPQPEMIEGLVAHPSLGYAGRFDLRAQIEGSGSCIVDLKTSRTGAIYREAHLQAVAYAVADEICGGGPVDDIILVGVGADGSFQRMRGQAGPADWGAVVALHKRLKRLDELLRAERKAAA